MVEIRKTHWMQVSEDLFLGEFEEPKAFYKQYGGPVDLYNELAKRAVAGTEVEEPVMTAYTKMYEAYAADQANNNYEQLNALIAAYKG